MLRMLGVHDSLRARRMKCIGIRGEMLYIQAVHSSSIDFWEVDSLHPGTWRRIVSSPVSLISYLVCCSSPTEPRIFCFFTGVAAARGPLELALIEFLIYEFDTRTGEKIVYTFDGEGSDCFPADVPFEMLTLGTASSNRLYLYDRTISDGPIPYWSITLINDEAGGHRYQLNRDDVVERTPPEGEDDGGPPRPASIKAYSIAFDPAHRVFGRIAGDSMLVFNADTSRWVEYTSNYDEVVVQRMPLTIRCMRETFGSHGHRVGAVESPLTFHTDPDSGACIARLADGRKHHFYQLFFDHENRRVVWSQRGAVELQNDIDRMFYSKYSNDIFVFVGFNSIAVVSLKPPSLESLATWCLQKSLFPSDDSKVGQTGGLTPAQVKECCRRQFLSLHFKSGTAEPGASEAGQNDVGATSGDSDPATEGADSGPTADQVDQTSDDSTWKTGSDNPLPDVVEDSGPCAPSQSPAEEVK